MTENGTVTNCDGVRDGVEATVTYYSTENLKAWIVMDRFLIVTRNVHHNPDKHVDCDGGHHK